MRTILGIEEGNDAGVGLGASAGVKCEDDDSTGEDAAVTPSSAPAELDGSRGSNTGKGSISAPESLDCSGWVVVWCLDGVAGREWNSRRVALVGDCDACEELDVPLLRGRPPFGLWACAW